MLPNSPLAAGCLRVTFDAVALPASQLTVAFTPRRARYLRVTFDAVALPASQLTVAEIGAFGGA